MAGAPPSTLTGGELVRRYPKPLANIPEINAVLRLGSRLIAVSRFGLDKICTASCVMSAPRSRRRFAVF